jgi:hypothetical protein
MMQTGEPHLSDLALDRLMTGELAGTDREGAVRTHLSSCLACAARRDALARSSAGFKVKQAARERTHGRLTDLLSRAEHPRRRAALWGSGTALAAIAAGLALVLVRPRPRPPEADLHAKGSLQLEAFIKRRSGAVEVLLPGGAVAPAESLRFRVSVPAAGFLGILSIDGAGAVNRYFPGTAALARVAAGPGQLLDGSIELDGVTGPELLVAVLCAGARDGDELVATFRDALTRAHGDATAVDLAEVAGGCRYATVSFRKIDHR